MRKKGRAEERLEKAQRIALHVFQEIGEKPQDGDMARAILEILPDVDEIDDPGWPVEAQRGEGE